MCDAPIMRCSTSSAKVPKRIFANGLLGCAPFSAATSLCTVEDGWYVRGNECR